MHEPVHCTVEELLREDAGLPEAGAGLRTRILRDAGQALLRQQRKRRERWIASIAVTGLACLAFLCTYLPAPAPPDFAGAAALESVEDSGDSALPLGSNHVARQAVATGSVEWESVEATMTLREAASRKLQQALWN